MKRPAATPGHPGARAPASGSRSGAGSSTRRAGPWRGRPCGPPTSTGRSSPSPRRPAGRTAGSCCGCGPAGEFRSCDGRDACIPGSSPRPRGSGPAGSRPCASPAPRTRRRSGWWRTARRSRVGSSTSRAGPSPAPGSRPEHLWFAREGSLSAWLDRARDGAIAGPWQGLDPVAVAGVDRRHHRPRRPLPPDGHRPRPARRAVRLRADDRHGPALRRQPRRGGDPHRRSRSAMMNRPSWDDLLSPPLRVRRRADPADRGDHPRQGHGPAHRRVEAPRHGLRPEQPRAAPGIEATTDAQGHYRLTGLPKAPAYRLFIEPGQGQPYTRATFVTPAGSPALEPIAFDIALKRGVLVRGRVTDKATGRPVSGYVDAYAFARQPARRRVPRLPRELRDLRAHRGRRPVRGRHPAGPRHHRLPLRPGTLPAGRRRRGDQGIRSQARRSRGLPHAAKRLRPSSNTTSWPRSTPPPGPSRRRWTSRSTPADR